MIYVSINGSTRTGQTVETDNSGFKKPIDLAIDADGYPYLLYADHPYGAPAVASWNGENWDIRVIGAAYAREAVLALDSSGTPHVAYTTGVKLRYNHGSDWMGSALKYASWTGTDWDIETVGSDMNSSFGQISLALNKKDEPYLLYSFSSENNSVIKLATVQNSNWRIQEVLLPPSTGSIGNVVLDSHSQAHFVCKQPYQGSTISNTILYASFYESQWSTQTVASNVEGGYVGKLVLDAQDDPHFIYSNHDGETKYAVYSDKSWKTQALPSEIGVGNLVLDQNGNPHTLYRTATMARYIDKITYATTTDMKATSPLAFTNNPDHTTLAVTAVAAFTIATVAIVIGNFVWKRSPQKKRQ
jgi:hypothetical protein